jgi:hypothetical protein
MPIDVRHLRSLRSRNQLVRYGPRDAALYALALGLGRDAPTAAEAAYLAPGPALRALPTLASELAAIGFLEDCGWQAAGVRHVREALRLHRPLADADALLVDGDVTGVYDQGPGAGAGIDVEFRARRQRDDAPVFTVQRRYLATADGGCGGPRASDAPPGLPARSPDLVEPVVTAPAQALWYAAGRPPEALLPAAATADAPPGELPAVAAFGLAGLVVLKVICEYDPTLVASLAAELVGPVHAGERLVAELWQDANVVRFRLLAPGRGVAVVDRGTCVLAT